MLPILRLPRLAALMLALAAPSAAVAQDPAFTAAEAQVREELARAGAPGVAVAVVRGDRVIYAQGFGVASAEIKTAVTPDTLFQIGSATKMLTAAALMSAHAAKSIDVDAPVSRYVGGLQPCVGAPTLRQLLSHTGGLMDEPDEFGPQGEEGLAAYPRTWTTEYCLLRPGRAFSYSNSGFALAGLALQEADKKPFADVMRARIFDPLGMTRTTFRPTDAMTWPLAIGHRRDNAGAFSAVRPLPNDARLWPAGTVYSSAQEMARFVIALLNDGKVDGKQALPAGLASTVRTAVATIPTTGEQYGLGQFLTERTFGHGGTMTGYTAQVGIDHVTGVGVVVLSNGDNAALTPITQTLLRAAGVPAAPPPAPFIAAGGVVPDLQPYVGQYRNPRRFTVEVARSGDGLVLKRFGRDFPLRPAGPDRFLTDLPRGGTETIAFGRGADGRADYLQMNVWALARVGG
jgi:CubicO group peptidase (beta-lactamase class C family)